MGFHWCTPASASTRIARSASAFLLGLEVAELASPTVSTFTSSMPGNVMNLASLRDLGGPISPDCAASVAHSNVDARRDSSLSQMGTEAPGPGSIGGGAGGGVAVAMAGSWRHEVDWAAARSARRLRPRRGGGRDGPAATASERIAPARWRGCPTAGCGAPFRQRRARFPTARCWRWLALKSARPMMSTDSAGDCRHHDPFGAIHAAAHREPDSPPGTGGPLRSAALSRPSTCRTASSRSPFNRKSLSCASSAHLRRRARPGAAPARCRASFTIHRGRRDPSIRAGAIAARSLRARCL